MRSIHTHKMFDVMHWELSVLSRCVAYPNLSTAAEHVGLSQPQLSRIVAKLEAHLGVVLLDRQARRKSGWTKAALDLATVYSQNERDLSTNLLKVTKGVEPTHIHIGTLEGLAPFVGRFSHQLFEKTKLWSIELDVFDVDQLEELFLARRLDLIFDFKTPGKKKYRHQQVIGYQSLMDQGSGREFSVYSSFEFHSKTAGRKASGQGLGQRSIISNSLEVRRRWIEEAGGRGRVPSSIQMKRPLGGESSEVIMLAQDDFSPGLWTMSLDIGSALLKSR